MTNENETPTSTLPTQNPAQAVDHLILAFEKSGMRTFTEPGPEETVFVTVREGKKRTDGTIGVVMRFTIESATGKIAAIQVL